ncbi:MAG: hypothetical protein V1872_09595 [bacterium]
MKKKLKFKKALHGFQVKNNLESMKSLRFFLLITIILLLSSCIIFNLSNRNTERYSLKNIPEYNIHSLAILPFEVPNYANNDFGIKVASIFSNKILNNKSFVVVEPAKVMEKIGVMSFNEPLSRVVKGYNIRELGEILGVDALFVGIIKKYIITNMGNSEISINLRLIHCNTGNILWEVTDLVEGKSDISYNPDPSLMKTVGKVSRKISGKPPLESESLTPPPPSLFSLVDKLADQMIGQLVF